MLGLWLENNAISMRDDLPVPEPTPGEALVKVYLSGICATDLEMVRGYYPFNGVLGHEFVGEVVKAPQNSGWIGKRVVGEINIVCGECDACRAGRSHHCANRSVLGIKDKNGSFAEFLTLPLKNLHPVPDNVPNEAAVFTEPMAAALEIQEQLFQDQDLQLRIGIHLGEVLIENGDIFSDGVNIAARLEALSDPGGICISRTAYDQIEDKLPLGYEYLGEKIVKNIPKPIQAYRVLVEPEEFTKKAWAWAKEIAEGPQEERKLEETFIGKPDSRRNRSKGVFKNHMYIYLGVIVFLFLINLFTYDGDIWFHFPALAWGLILFIHWRLLNSGISLTKSTEESSSISARKRLIAAILLSSLGFSELTDSTRAKPELV